MLKLTRYINPDNKTIHCLTLEFINPKDNRPVFKAYYDEALINEFTSENWLAMFKDETGLNIAHIYIEEYPDE